MGPTPAISMPKLVPGLASQALTNAVTSTNTNVLATLTGTLANGAAMEGPGKVTVVSTQGDVT